MCELLKQENAHVDDIQYCPHQEADHCACRKPKPGMILNAAQNLQVNPANGWLIGDQARDIVAGKAAGCRTLRIGPEADGTAEEDVFLPHTSLLPAWIKENLPFQKKEGCQN
jgi:D-glycero-D-manno-heptose 1,7-bisphosphate phosphatase